MVIILYTVIYVFTRPTKIQICCMLPHLILRLKSLMIARLSALMVKFEPSSKLKVADPCPLDFDFATSVPSIRTLTSPWSLQFPNLSVALPFDQNVVDIIEVCHPCTSQLEPLEPSRSFKSHCFPRNTNRFSSSMLSRFQPFSFIAP